MFLDLSLATFGYVLLVILANSVLWGRAITVRGERIDRAEVALFMIIMLLFLGVAACFLVVMKRSELAVCLTAWAFLIGAVLSSGATGLLYAKYNSGEAQLR